MQTKITKMFGIDSPIFAFSHCRDVVAEATRAGGMGVFGIATHSFDHLEEELKWIDRHTDGGFYGVDILMPNTFETVGDKKLDPGSLLPAAHQVFVRNLLDNAGIEPLPSADRDSLLAERISHINIVPEEGEKLLKLALAHPQVKLAVNALGTPPKELVDYCHSRGVLVGSLIGKPGHAKAQKDAGVDLVVAQGSEAGGHTGKISSMVLWPQVVDTMGEIPVLAAGGIGRGRQVAAALALGCEGVWCGSIWLGTAQSDLLPEMKQRLFEAKAEDAIQTRMWTGKPCRILRSKLSDAWDRSDAPPPLPLPLQTILIAESRLRINRARAKDFMSNPVGQIVGDMNEETSVRQVFQQFLEEYVDTMERLNKLTDE
jgi:NAD(P)H-dependent flavin oxidoreductase YrpB (nitropropane dioxygenase family)